MKCRATPPDPSRGVDATSLGPAYPYLLGIYLGDGMLTRAPRNVWKLRITLYDDYPDIIARVKAAISDVGERRAGESKRRGCIEVYSNWKHWLFLFPQHQSGPKHERPIVLDLWQAGMVKAHPGAFLAGMIHSDGCRCINRVKGFEYPRYFFSNLSVDIRNLFVDACASVGVESRLAGRRNISVARRSSVAILDRLVGPKA